MPHLPHAGVSMLPTFNAKGDWVLSERLSVFSQTIRTGDVVVSRANHTPRLTVVKRVLGLEGDTVQVPHSTRDGPARTVKVPTGHVWLQGDNTLNSTDSRHYGPVPYALLEGRVFLRVWPLWQTGWVENKVASPF
eukprot:jgi/Astpho2/5047/e_gw1.00071.72.1_t